MPFSETLVEYRNENHLTQGAAAKQIPVDRTLWNKWEHGVEPAEHHDFALSKLSWKLALEIIDKRTNGWIKNRFDDLDPTPTALQLQLRKEMQEAQQALEGIILGNNIDWSDRKRDEQLAKLEKEISDVAEVAPIMKGVIQDMRRKAKKGGRK